MFLRTLIMKKNILILSLLLLSACDPVTILVGGTVAGTTAAARNSLGIGGTISDAEIKSSIESAFAKYDSDIFSRVELSVKHGHVVIIGYMNDEEQCARAIEIAQKIPGPVNILNELKVGPITDTEQNISDSAITSRIKSCLTFDGNVKSMNYDITTVKGIVYIVGTAGSPYEQSVVINHARTTSGVEKVIAYIYIHEGINEE